MDSTVVDTTFKAILDSTHVAGWLAPVALKIPETLRPYIMGLLVALVVDIAQSIINSLQKYPVFKQLEAIWSSHSRVISPLLVIVASVLSTGNPLSGVIAAGVRGILFNGSITDATHDGLKKIGGAAVLLAMLGIAWAPGSAKASQVVTTPPVAAAPHVSWFDSARWNHYALGLGQRWNADDALKLRAGITEPFAIVRWRYGIFDHVALDTEAHRGLAKGSRWWEVQASLLLTH